MRLRETVGLDVTVVLRAGAAPGPEKVLGDIRDALCGSTLGLDIGPVTVLRESPIHAGGHREAFTALFSLTQDVPAAV